MAETVWLFSDSDGDYGISLRGEYLNCILSKLANERANMVPLMAWVHEARKAGRSMSGPTPRTDELFFASEAKFRKLIEGSILGVIIHGDGKILYCNQAIAEMHGFTPDEMVGTDPDLLVPPESLERIREYRAQGADGHYEIQALRRDGSLFWLIVSAREITWNGRPARQITCIDISERKKAEEALRLQSVVIEQMHEAVLVTDLERRIIDANPACERLMGRTREELIGHEPVDFFGAGYSPEQVIAATEEFGQWRGEMTLVDGSGKHREVEIVITPLCGDGDQLIARVGVFRDITERKRTENALRASEAKFRNLIDTSVQGVVIHQDGFIVYLNQAYAEIHGYKIDQLVGMEADKQIAPEELETVRALRKIDRVNIPEFRGMRRDGSVVWLAGTGCDIDWDGRPARQVTVVDISERKRAEQTLRRQAIVMAQINDSVVITDLDRRIIDCNKAAEEMVGLSRTEMIGKTPTMFFADPDAHAERFPHILKQLKKAGRWTGEFLYRKKDGRSVICDVNLTPLFDESGKRIATIAVRRDITERKRAEEAARQHSEELSQVLRRNTMGEMTSALAHELNQPLASIANYCRGSLHRLQSGDVKDKELISAIRKASEQAERAGAMIRQIGDFVRGAEPHKEHIDINEIVRDIVPIATAEANQNNVQIELDLAEGLAPVYTQAIEIQHVILNLLRNGIEAVIRGSEAIRRVTVKTSLNGTDAVEVNIHDTGAGLSHDIRDKVFEPFFTTKPRGMGMGLAISRSIVERNGGELRVLPEASNGTTFVFKLPIEGSS